MGGPPKRRATHWLFLEVNYLFRINFCSAWICLLIEAISATIDFNTSSFVTEEPPVDTLYATETASAYAKVGKLTTALYEPEVKPVAVPTVYL